MYNEHILVRIVLLLVFLVVLGGILGILVWRWSVMLGISIRFRHIVMLAFGLVALFISGIFLGHGNWYPTQILGTVLVAMVYSLWVLIPVLVVVEIVHVRYKLPVVLIVMLSMGRLGMGLYFGTSTKVTSITLASPKVQKAYTIVFISDLHINAVRHRAFVQSLVNRIKTVSPDMVLIGGDIFDSAKEAYGDALAPFMQIAVPVVAILGNHDAMGEANVDELITTHAPITVLRNERIFVDNFQIVGIDDESFRGSKTLTGVMEETSLEETGQFTILLSHRPQHLSKLATYPVDLQLAGHTHRGQFIPLSWIIGWFNDYAYGLYQEGGKTAFVSQGVGLRGVPIRTGTRSEMVVISIVPKT